MNENPKIYSVIKKVMTEIDAIGKNRENMEQNFTYRGVDDIMNELHPLLAKHGLFIVPEVLSEERTERTTSRGSVLLYSRQKIKFTFFAAEDGSSISAVIIGEGMDTGDKASNKALSIAFKYACLQVFCIPTKDLKDPDGNSYDIQETGNSGGEFERVSSQIKSYIEKGLYSKEMIERINGYLKDKNIDKLNTALKWAGEEIKKKTQQQGERRNAGKSIMDYAR